MKAPIRQMSFGILVMFLHSCAHESAPAEGPRAQRSESFGFSDRCVKRPSASLVAPERAEHDAGVQWIPAARDRWTQALVGYHGVVSPLNVVRLGDERMDFGKYLVSMHERIHPFFSDRYLEALTDQPAGDPRNDMTLTTLVEIVIARDGSISQLGVVCPSGNEDFDIGVLDSISWAVPFAPPAPTTLSSDGKLYLRWWFGRNPVLACAVFYARPFKLVLDATDDAGVASPR